MVKVDEVKCDLCGECVTACPMDVLSTDLGYWEIDKSRCSRCYLCLISCPQKALSPSRG